MEIWKKVLNYDDYEASNFGNVRSLKKRKPKILKPSISSSGYLQVILCRNGKTKNYFIHRLVAEAFIKKTNNYNEINHLDENKKNNKVENLEWCNRKENMNYGNIKQKISVANSKKVVKLNSNGAILNIYNSILEASKLNEAQSTHIVRCCKHKAKTHKGYKWEYFENMI